jgi:hypothetical protein
LPAVAVSAVLAAGAVAGAVLGWGQAIVLKRALPRLSRRRWIAVTSAGAAIAYVLGLFSRDVLQRMEGVASAAAISGMA